VCRATVKNNWKGVFKTEALQTIIVDVQMKQLVRIACSSGFWGDSPDGNITE
jgi:hypothetical protein